MDFARRLKPNHLRLILKIVETGKLQLAANDLGMSQPAASRILSDIETEAQSQLFERTPNGMKVTPVGRAFERHARLVLTNIESLNTEVQDLNHGAAGKIRIGSVTGPAVGNLVPAVQQIRATARNLEVTIEVGPSTTLVRGLEEGKFDFVIARIPPEYNSRNFRIYPARYEIVSFLVRRDHPLQGRENLKLAELNQFDWVIQESGSPIRQAVENAFHARGVEMPDRITNTSSLLVALAMLAGSDVIAPQTFEVAELLTGKSLNANIAVLDLAEAVHVSPYFIVLNRNQQLSPAAEGLFSTILRTL